MTTKQIWVALCLVAAVLIGIALYLGIDINAVGRALLWLKEFVR